MVPSLAATLQSSAHRELRESYPRVVAFGALLAVLLHLLLLRAGGMPAPVPFALRSVEPPVFRVEQISYRVVPDAPPAVRPPLDPELDFDAIVSADPFEPRFMPPPEALWAAPARVDPEGSAGPASFHASPETPPELLHRVAPAYPELARMAGAEGRMVLGLLIDETGRVRDVQVVSSDAAATLERAAIEAVRGWLFAPARQGGQPVAVRIEVPIEFRLH